MKNKDRIISKLNALILKSKDDEELCDLGGDREGGFEEMGFQRGIEEAIEVINKHT